MARLDGATVALLNRTRSALRLLSLLDSREARVPAALLLLWTALLLWALGR